MSSLNRLIYISQSQIESTSGASLKELTSIMRASTRNNERVGLTGALVFADGWFLQALEGERHAVWQTFRRIDEDQRHADCVLVEMVEAGERMFGNWWMGFATLDATSAPTFEPYLRGGMLHPETMGAAVILDLMGKLAKLGLRREMRAAA